MSDERETGPAEGLRAAIEAGQDALAGPVEETLSAARAALGRAGRALGQEGASRQRRLRRLAKQPLPLLYEVHPEARRALPHPLGLRTVKVADVAGSAVEPPQRGGDFLPLRPFRSGNWRARWQRLGAANDDLAHFPPIDVYQYADRYWVMDGHNRVALALYEDQAEIDANVTALHLPGDRPERAGELAPLLGETREATGRNPRLPRAAEPSPERRA